MKMANLMLALDDLMQDKDMSEYEIFAHTSSSRIDAHNSIMVFCETKIGEVIVLHDVKEIHFIEE